MSEHTHRWSAWQQANPHYDTEGRHCLVGNCTRFEVRSIPINPNGTPYGGPEYGFAEDADFRQRWEEG